MLEKFPADKANVTKHVIFFLAGAPTHLNFFFNSRFSYQLKQKVRLSKSKLIFGNVIRWSVL